AAGIDPVAEHHRTRPGSGRSLPEIARAWYGSRQGQRADNTLEGDRRSLAYLTDYYKDNTDINDITTAGVSKFIEHLNRINIPACARAARASSRACLRLTAGYTPKARVFSHPPCR
ncbi:TPA: hypothetical protein ACQQKO_001869, partial [Neisseria gonorrhoeae]